MAEIPEKRTASTPTRAPEFGIAIPALLRYSIAFETICCWPAGNTNALETDPLPPPEDAV